MSTCLCTVILECAFSIVSSVSEDPVLHYSTCEYVNMLD